MLHRLRFIVIGFAPLMGWGGADALFRFQASAPIQKFSMPFFNEWGRQTGICTGDEIQYASDTQFQVARLCIMLFNSYDPAAVDLFIRSDEAAVMPLDRQIKGESLLTVTHAHYVLLGEQWVWMEKDPEQSCCSIQIGQKASITFYEQGRSPVRITSDRMTLSRFIDRNEFVFQGNVILKADHFYGSCDHLWVGSQSEQQMKHLQPFPVWSYLQGNPRHLKPFFCWILSWNRSTGDLAPIGHLKLIVAQKHIALQVEDPKSGELRQAKSQKAVIYPENGELVLTGQAAVHCSVQGTFRGEKITFYKESERVLVEKAQQGMRSQVILE